MGEKIGRGKSRTMDKGPMAKYSGVGTVFGGAGVGQGRGEQ